MHAHSIPTQSYWKLAHLNFLPLGNRGLAFKIHIFMSLLVLFYLNIICEFFPPNWLLKAAFVERKLMLKARLFSTKKASAAL